MTIKELILKLEEYEDDTDVTIFADGEPHHIKVGELWVDMERHGVCMGSWPSHVILTPTEFYKFKS